jgi:PPK2 family polyphosphate:nucleotide phosphotransferase
MSGIVERLRVEPGGRAGGVLGAIDPRETFGWEKEQAKARLAEVTARLDALQQVLYAEGTRGVVVVLQGMDAAGKDGTTRAVFGPLNAQGVHVQAFKKPTSTELAQDYLWRAHAACPARGHIAVWNRSHYEDVLVVRVKQLVPESVWMRRFEHINAFERLLVDEGFVVVKCMLHVSAEEQGERLAERLKDPAKAWKFNADDFDTRRHRSAYVTAYEDVLARCSTGHAPWHVVPADRNWVRDLCVGEVVLEAIEGLRPRLPALGLTPEEIREYLARVE